MKSLQLLILTFVSLLFMVQCKKDLPKETQMGSDTFGCYVDGKLFVPKGSPLAGPRLKAQYYTQNGKSLFSISATMTDGEELHSVSISGDSVNLAAGTYEISTPGSGKVSGSYTFYQPFALETKYRTTNMNTGQLVIKYFDKGKGIISGTFWFNAFSDNGQLVQVLDGRFDVKLY